MTDKQDFEIKETLTYGHELLTGKQTKYEFVKQDFEKDIDVPSKQIIVDDVDMSGKSKNYKLGKTKIERQQVFEDIKEMIENGFSLQNIADKYGVTRQAISLKMINCGFNVSQEVKRIKREKIKKLLEETSVNNVEKLNCKVKQYKIYNHRLRNDLTELKEKLKAKEQECERLKHDNGYEVGALEKTIDNLKAELEQYKDLAEHNGRVCNERLDKIDKLEHDINELNGQLDQLKKERKALGRAYLTTSELLQDKMKECTNHKVENEELKKYKEVVDKLAGMQVILTNENGVPQLYDNAKDLKLKQFSKTLIEIKEIAEEAAEQSGVSKEYFKRNNYSWKQHQLKALTCKFNIILQKISEVKNEGN